MISFSFLDKTKFGENAPQLFSILANNMANIAPTGNPYEDDFKLWFSAVGEGLRQPARKILLIIADKEIIGYFQYFANDGLFMMEEIQIAPQWQGKSNIFRRIYQYILPLLPKDIVYVEAFANKSNAKSCGILKAFGLSIIGENRNGSSYHLRGKYTEFAKHFI